MNDDAELVLAGTLSRLVGSTTLTRPQAEAVSQDFTAAYHRPAPAPVPRLEPAIRSAILIEVGGYVGAAFVVAAATALVAPTWDSLSTAARIAIQAGPALLLLLGAVLLVTRTPGGWSGRPGEQSGGPRRRLVSVLVLAIGVLSAGVTVTALGDSAQQDRAVTLTLLVVWACGYALTRAAVLHLATAGTLTWLVFALVAPSWDEHEIAAGGVLMLTAIAWAALTARRLIDQPDLGYSVAGAMAFLGAEVIAENGSPLGGYALMLALAAAGLAGYLRFRQVSALAIGALALAVVVPQAIIHYTDGSLGAAGALLVCGLSIVAASALGLHLRKTVDSGPGIPHPTP